MTCLRTVLTAFALIIFDIAPVWARFTNHCDWNDSCSGGSPIGEIVFIVLVLVGVGIYNLWWKHRGEKEYKEYWERRPSDAYPIEAEDTPRQNEPEFLAAAKGDPEAQCNLGDMYLYGEGVPEDPTEAVRWYRLAAEQGFAMAQFNLGGMYMSGEGVPEDDTEAVRWYRLAAEQGLQYAQSMLGVLYLNGLGVPEDHVSAYMWCTLAAAQGDEMAKENKDIVAKQMTREQIAEAQRLSRECLARNYKGC